MLSWQHLCISLFIKEWSHIVRFLFLSFLSNLRSIMVNMSLHSEKWRGDGGRLSTCCAVLSRWVPLGMPRSSADGEPDICSVSGCFCAEPSQAGRGMRVRDELEGAAVTPRVSQAGSLTPSCCLSLVSKLKMILWSSKSHRLLWVYSSSNFWATFSVSQWSWADCLWMRHLAGSPPEQRGMNPGKVSLSFPGKRVECSGSLLQSWPIIKKDDQK